jgi:mannose-1-phosphate guanylyltransferase
VVVDTPDALLVVPRDQAQRVKDLVDLLRANGRDEVL